MKYFIKVIFFLAIFLGLCQLAIAQSKKEQIVYLQNKVDSLKVVVFKYNKSSQHFSELADSVISKNNDLQGEVNKLAIEKKSIKESLNRAEKSIIEKENQIKILNNEIEDISFENQELSDQIKALEKQIETKNNQNTGSKDYNLPMIKIGMIDSNPIFLDQNTERYYILEKELVFTLPNYGNFTIYYFSNGSCTELSDLLSKINVICRVLILDSANNVKYDKVFDPSPQSNDIFGQTEPEIHQFESSESLKTFFSTISTGCGSDHERIFCTIGYNGSSFSFYQIARFSGGYSFIEFDESEDVFYFMTRIDPPCHYDCYSNYEVSIYSIHNIELFAKTRTKLKYNDFNMMNSSMELINEIKKKEPGLFKF